MCFLYFCFISFLSFFLLFLKFYVVVCFLRELGQISEQKQSKYHAASNLFVPKMTNSNFQLPTSQQQIRTEELRLWVWLMLALWDPGVGTDKAAPSCLELMKTLAGALNRLLGSENIPSVFTSSSPSSNSSHDMDVTLLSGCCSGGVSSHCLTVTY